jgi:hypothetical protein
MAAGGVAVPSGGLGVAAAAPEPGEVVAGAERVTGIEPA